MEAHLQLTNQSNKYSTRYINSSSISVGNVFYQAGKIGDATKEVYLGGTSTFNWFSDYGYMVDSRYPFFNRGRIIMMIKTMAEYLTLMVIQEQIVITKALE